MIKRSIWAVGTLFVLGVACSGSSEDAGGGSGGKTSNVGGTKNEGGKSSHAGSGGTQALAGGGAGGAGGEAGGGGKVIDHRCTAPTTDPKTGLVKCAEGYFHRHSAKLCGETIGQGGAGPGVDPDPDPRAKGNERCDIDGSGGEGGASTNCSQFAYGYCEVFEGGVGGAIGLCRSGCATDDDCGDGYICVCDTPDSPTGGACQPSNCKVDDDCGAGLLCASYDVNGCDPPGFACQAPSDTCQGTGDCDEGVCNWSSDDERRFCDTDRCEP